MRYSLLNTCLLLAGLLALIALRKPVPTAPTNRSSNTFAPFAVRVIDHASSSPIHGAQVQVVCLGDTPYATASYQTNPRGYTTVMAYQDSPWLILNINAPGFKPRQLAVPVTNAIVKLNLVK